MKITYENILRAELSKKNGSIKLKGKSIIEASADFYKNIIEWLDLYVSQPNDQTRVDIYLEYYNTISSKYLHSIFTKLEYLHKSGNSNVFLKWHYESDDEDMKYTGEQFCELFNLPVELVAIDEFDFSVN